MSILTVTLNPAIDRMLKVDRFLMGQDQRAALVSVSMGGKGVNLARALTALGVKSFSLTFLDDSPELMRINVSVKDAQGRVTRFLEPGVFASDVHQRAFLRKFRSLVKGFNGVVFSGSLPPGMKPVYLASLVEIAKQQKAWVAVDASPLALKAAIKEGVDLVKPNQKEAEVFLGEKLLSRKRISKALRTFGKCGIKDVLISMGSNGLYGFDGASEYFARGPVVSKSFAVGCGDSALAGFIAGRVSGKDFKGCVRFAAACGCVAAQKNIPGAITMKDVVVAQRNIVCM